MLRGIVLLTVLATSVVAHAGTIVLNAPTPLALDQGPTVMDARYRLSQTNWDQVIATSSNVTYGTIVENKNVGTANQLNGVEWDWSMAYTAGSGYVFTLSKPGTTSTVQWTAPWTNTYVVPNETVSPLRSFNAIYLYAAAYTATGITSAQFDVTDLSFSGAGITNSGSLANLQATLPPGELVDQWLIADCDLSQIDWTLTAKVKGTFTGTPPSNYDERLKFDIKTKMVVPEPATLGLLAVSGLAMLRRRR